MGEEQAINREENLLKFRNKGSAVLFCGTVLSKWGRVGSHSHSANIRLVLVFVFKSTLRWHFSITEGLGVFSKLNGLAGHS